MTIANSTRLGAGMSVFARFGRSFRLPNVDEFNFTSPNVPFRAPANVNLAPTCRQGIELEQTEPLAESFRLHVNAALRRATFRSGSDAGSDVPFTPRRTLALLSDWQPTASQQVGVLLNHVGAPRPACAAGVTNAADRKYDTQAATCTAGVVESIYPKAGRGLTASMRFDYQAMR